MGSLNSNSNLETSQIMYPTIFAFLLVISTTFINVEGNGKSWCKGRNFPGGRECCESEDPEGSKCTEGQGDCDSDDGCAGGLVCGNNNCKDYHYDAAPDDDCCTTGSSVRDEWR